MSSIYLTHLLLIMNEILKFKLHLKCKFYYLFYLNYQFYMKINVFEDTLMTLRKLFIASSEYHFVSYFNDVLRVEYVVI